MAAAAVLGPVGLAGGARAAAARPLATRGVVYDTGFYFGYEGQLTRMSWHEADVRRDIAAIRYDLHCTAIQIIGTEHDRLELAALIAVEHGLQVWLQPRLLERGPEEQLDHMAAGAELAERLAAGGGDVVFSVGCETTLFQRGIVPGNLFSDRSVLFSARGGERRRINAALNGYLARAVEAARAAFSGPLTYSAGAWEQVDWSIFDIAGVDLYRDASNRSRYRDILRGHMGHGVPLVITEFGISTYVGAADQGAAGFMIVDYSTMPPTIPAGYVRSEDEQAREIGELITLYAEEEVAGCFVYTFLSQFDVHSDEPRKDLDMASHAIVKVAPGDATAPMAWEPKRAFEEVARLYAEL